MTSDWPRNTSALIGVYVALAVINVSAHLAQVAWPASSAHGIVNISQYLLMPTLAIALWQAAPVPRPRIIRWAGAGLAFSWLGDVLPDLVPSSIAFIALVVPFLGAQLCYIIALFPRRHRSALSRWWAVAGAAVFLALMVWLMAPQAGVLVGPVVVYGACLLMTALLATSLGHLGTLGGALFVTSDMLIALRQFEVFDPWASGFWVMLTYAAAQLFLISAIYRASLVPSIPNGVSAQRR